MPLRIRLFAIVNFHSVSKLLKKIYNDRKAFIYPSRRGTIFFSSRDAIAEASSDKQRIPSKGVQTRTMKSKLHFCHRRLFSADSEFDEFVSEYLIEDLHEL